MKICGLDEVGRGALAGPLVAAATILDNQCPIPNLNDSKKLSPIRRKLLCKKILSSRARVKIETISVEEINKRGIGWANREIFKRLIRKIEADKYIVDGNLKITVNNKCVKNLIRADCSRKCVMAASIIAKVFRDDLMKMLHKYESCYGWNKNMGYGTKIHIESLKLFGKSKHHRIVFVNTVLEKH